LSAAAYVPRLEPLSALTLPVKTVDGEAHDGGDPPLQAPQSPTTTSS
jgi:hypothetical protein